MPPVWERIIATPGMVRRFAGTVPMSEASTATMRELFRRLDEEGGGFVHYADLPLAERWANEAARLASAAEEARADAAGVADQNELTVKLWNAIGHTYRALNIPWVVDPEARVRFLRCTKWRDSSILCDEGSWSDRAVPLGAYDSPELGRCVHLVHRIIMEPDGTVGAPALYNGQGTGSYWGQGVHHGRQIWGWKSYAWHYDCKRRPGAGACQAWVSEFFTPLHWWYLLGRDIARSLLERGMLQVIFQSLRACVVFNLQTAAKARVLAAAAGEPVAAAVAPLVGLGDLQLAEGVAAYQDGGDTAVFRQQLTERLGYVGAGAGAVVTAVSLAGGASAAAAGVAGAAAASGAGLVFGAVIAIGLLLSYALPSAVARNTDPFGRNRPTFERPTISGDIRTPPTHTVPDPPVTPDRRPYQPVTASPRDLSPQGQTVLDAIPPPPRRTPGEKAPPTPPPGEGGGIVLWEAPAEDPPGKDRPRDAPPPADTPPAPPPPAEPSSMAPLALAAALVAAVAYAASRRR